LSINPSSASGLEGCTDAEFGKGSNAPSTCPPGSKIGSVTVKTPLLEESLEGSAFLGTQLSNDPQSGEMFRLFLEMRDDQRGVAVKLRGQIRVNPDTGQIETIFDDNPQLPFEDLKLDLKTGSRAPLVNPDRCGTYTSVATLTPWSGGAPVKSESSFTIDENCG